MTIPVSLLDDYFKQGYRFIGKHKHSAIKICNWTRESIRAKNICYKQKFYGIQTHRCIQMSPSVFWCTHACRFCWRKIEESLGTNMEKESLKKEIDSPEEILDTAIEAQRKILQGFKGSENTDMKKFKEAMLPNQVAISLAGEPTLYPKLPEFIKLINSRNMTSFLVTNGTRPDVLKKLSPNPPYQLYITLASSDKETYKKVCCPLIKDGWENLNKSLELMKKINTRTVLRLTLVKDLNMNNPEKFAELIEKASPQFIEAKAYMAIGYSRERLGPAYMPSHEEIKEFSKKIAENSNYKIADEKADSRVVLLKK